MSKMVIRHATLEDASLIADISRRTFYDTYAEHNTKSNMEKFMNEQFTHENLQSEVTEPGNTFLLAFYDSELAGYARLRETETEIFKNKNAIEIARIYATKNFIGKGIGKELIQKCIEVAKEKHSEIIWLCVWEKNERAIDFYIKCGFAKCGKQNFILGDDVQQDWLMKRNLFEE